MSRNICFSDDLTIRFYLGLSEYVRRNQLGKNTVSRLSHLAFNEGRRQNLLLFNHEGCTSGEILAFIPRHNSQRFASFT